MPGNAASWVQVRAGLLGWLMLATSTGAVADCVHRTVSWELAQAMDRSSWSEFDIAGHPLVHESGTLSGPELSVTWRCDNWDLRAQLVELAGTRRYDGHTSTGAPVMSTSALIQRQAQFQASLRLSDAWQLAGRLTSQKLWRDIASSGGAMGYPERYDWTMLSMGLRWQSAPGPSQLWLVGWTGTQLDSGLTLQLPGRDQSKLPLGTLRQFELATGWRMLLSPAWQVQLDAGYCRNNLARGASHVITRSGVPVAVAEQPQTQLVDRTVAIRIIYEF